MKKILFVVLFAYAGFVMCGKPEVAVDAFSSKISVITGNATDVDPTTAKLNADISINSTTAVDIAAYFYYSSEEDKAKAIIQKGAKVSVGTISNLDKTFAFIITNLSPDTEYHFIASIVVEDKEYTGSVASFKTKEKPKELSVTGSAFDITEFTASLSGYANITPDMENVLMGIILSENKNPTLDNGVELTSKEIDGNNMYSVKATNLRCNTTYYYKSFVKYGGVYRSGEVRSFTTRDYSIIVRTEDATAVQELSATLNGTIRIESIDDIIITVLFYYSANHKDIESLTSLGYALPASLKEDGTFSINTKNEPSSPYLRYNTEYYYVACVFANDKVVFGDVVAFRTLDLIASVSAEPASDVTELSATLNGKLACESKESSLMKSVWFYYSEFDMSEEELQSKGTLTRAFFTENDYFSSEPIKSLTPGKTYHYIAAAKIQDKTVYSNVASFEALSINAQCETLQAQSITETHAELRGEYRIDSNESFNVSTYFLYSDSYYDLESLKKDGVIVSANSNFSYNLTNLSSNTTYYYVACVKVHDIEFYGTVKSFKTNEIILSINDYHSKDITEFRASISGSCEIKCVESIQPEIWLYYSDSDATIEEIKEHGRKRTIRGFTGNQFVFNLSELSPGTEYYYMISVAALDRVITTDINCFTTLDYHVSITTDLPAKIDYYSVLLNASLFVDSIEELETEVLFAFGTDSNEQLLLENGSILNAKCDDNGKYEAYVTKLDKGTEYYYIAFAKVHNKYYYGNVQNVTTLDKTIPLGAVDLGLSVLWSQNNLGAGYQQLPGDFYAWGEVAIDGLYSYSSYKWGHGYGGYGSSVTNLTKYNTISQYGPVDNITQLESDDDAASVSLGCGWRMPTYEEAQELITLCSWEYVTLGGVQGYNVKSNVNNNSIFLPVTGRYHAYMSTRTRRDGSDGYYWLATLDISAPIRAFVLRFENGNNPELISESRIDGCAIRAVIE